MTAVFRQLYGGLDEDNAFMQAVYRQLDELDEAGARVESYDAEAALERFRAGLRRMDEDPDELERIERLVKGTERLYRDLGLGE